MALYQICVLLGRRSVTCLRSLKKILLTILFHPVQLSTSLGARASDYTFLHYSEWESQFNLVYCHYFCCLLTSDIDTVWTVHRIGARKSKHCFIHTATFSNTFGLSLSKQQEAFTSQCLWYFKSGEHIPSSQLCSNTPLISLYRHYTSYVCVISKCH